MKRALVTASLVLLLLAGLSALGLGCNKATGGGSFISYDPYDEADIRLTVGFNAQPTDGDTAKGEFQVIAHHLDNSVTRVRGTFEGTADGQDRNEAEFWGTCSVNGQDGYDLYAYFLDEGQPGTWDWVYVRVSNSGGAYYEWWGTLRSGNIQVHKAKG